MKISSRLCQVLLLGVALAWLGMETAMLSHHHKVLHKVALDGTIVHVLHRAHQPLQQQLRGELRPGHADGTVANFAKASFGTNITSLSKPALRPSIPAASQIPIESFYLRDPLGNAPKTSPPSG